MPDSPLIHDTPFPLAVRIVLCAVGAGLLVVVPHDLWRGVWPPNGLTPFFGLLVLAGMGGGALAIFTGLFSPHQTLVFRPGELEVREASPWRARLRRFPLAEISGIAVEFKADSDGPDTWRAVIRTTGGAVYTSRPFDTEDTAQKHAAAFRAALGL